MAKDTGWGMHSEMFPQQELRHLPTFAKEMIAGGIAGGLSKTCVAPLERVKILFQTGMMSNSSVSRTLLKIAREEGISGWYRGNGASVLRVVPYAAFHFTAYEKFRSMLAARLYGCETRHHHIPPWLDLLAGSAAGGTAVLLTYPLDLVRTRLAYGNEKKDSGEASAQPRNRQQSSQAASNSGMHIAANKKGYHTSSQQSFSLQPGGQSLSVTEQQRERQSSSMNASSSARGIPSRGTALPHSRGLSTKPSTVVSQHSMQRGTIRSVLRDTLRAEGVAGLYRGIGPTLLGIVPYAGSKFFLYQTMKQKYWAMQTSGHQSEEQREQMSQRLPVWLMLSFGGLAGVAAQTMTYPLDVVRRQMQVQHYGARGSDRFVTSTWAGLKHVYRQRGLQALFAGLSINYMKVVPSTAIGFTVYDSAKQYLGLPQNL